MFPLAFLYFRKSALMDELLVIKLYKFSFVVLITGLWSYNVYMGLESQSGASSWNSGTKPHT